MTTIKTPEQVARETVNRVASIHAERLNGENAVSIAAAAVRADRAEHATVHTCFNKHMGDDAGERRQDALDTLRTATALERWTVIGAWIEDEPVGFGAIRGEHEVGGGGGDAQPWATSVEADSPDTAVEAAVTEMRSETTEDRMPQGIGEGE